MRKETFSKKVKVNHYQDINPAGVTIWFSGGMRNYNHMKSIVKEFSSYTAKYLKLKGKSDLTMTTYLWLDTTYLSVAKSIVSPPNPTKLMPLYDKHRNSDRVLLRDADKWTPMFVKNFEKKHFKGMTPKDRFLLTYRDELWKTTVRVVSIVELCDGYFVTKDSNRFRNFKYSGIVEMARWDDPTSLATPHTEEFLSIDVSINQLTEAKSEIAITSSQPENFRSGTITLK